MSDDLDNRAADIVADALRHARGRYLVERASQLSGIPRSTLYDWRRSGIYTPDFDESPTAWSYRDLILLRLLAWLRQGGMARGTAAKQVRRLRRDLAEGRTVRRVFATRVDLMVEPETESRTGGNLLPFDDLYALVRQFDLYDPIAELGGRRLWAPNLVKPSEKTTISPRVLAGDPCVERTRIPTSSIFALETDRGLSAVDIVELYPDLSVDAVRDAVALERRLRGLEPPERAAA